MKKDKIIEPNQEIKASNLRYCDGMSVEVKIVGMKKMFGREFRQISPVSGRGKEWVMKKTLKPVKK